MAYLFSDTLLFNTAEFYLFLLYLHKSIDQQVIKKKRQSTENNTSNIIYDTDYFFTTVNLK